MKENTITLFGLGDKYLQNKLPFEFPIASSAKSFYVKDSENKKYVAPILKINETNVEKDDIPNVICISAAGATGKSELSKYLSAHYTAPIFNLSLHDAVGSNSLTGILFDSLGYDDALIFIAQLRTGKSFLIIDAMDEGYLKTTANGYDSFLDNIASISKTSPNTCVVILGRTQAIDHTYLYLDEKGVKVSLLSIEAFTIGQAKEFIDKQLDIQGFEQQYIIVRDYIIETIEGFFKNQSDIKKSQYLSFIGYAPVLLSITLLLSQERNYKKLHEELLAKNDKNIDLIITIIELILNRDKEEKININLLPSLLNGRSNSFKDNVYNTIYNIDEQCYRIIAFILSKPINLNITGDNTFDSLYEEKICNWIKEHPFIENKKIQNAVFESYIIARLIQNDSYANLAYEYLNTVYKDAFMFFFIYDKLSKDRKLDRKILPFLYASIKSLDNSEHVTSLSIDETNIDKTSLYCDVSFQIDDKSYNYECKFPQSETLFIGDFLSDVAIDADDAKIQLNKSRCILIPPISITCNTLYSYPSEIIIENTTNINSDNTIVFDCEHLNIDYSHNGQYILLYRNRNTECLNIFTSQRPDYPFDAYWSHNKILSELTEEQLSLFKKLRKIIVLFKSHSKGRMAKFKDKINNRRVCGTGIGKTLLTELLNKHVLYLEGEFYFISPENMDIHLGLSYDQIKMGIINDKTKKFLVNLTHPTPLT